MNLGLKVSSFAWRWMWLTAHGYCCVWHLCLSWGSFGWGLCCHRWCLARSSGLESSGWTCLIDATCSSCCSYACSDGLMMLRPLFSHPLLASGSIQTIDLPVSDHPEDLQMSSVLARTLDSSFQVVFYYRHIDWSLSQYSASNRNLDSIVALKPSQGPQTNFFWVCSFSWLLWASIVASFARKQHHYSWSAWQSRWRLV